jgi:hypothetical protein
MGYIQREDLILGGMEVNFSPLFPKAKKIDPDSYREGDRRDKGYGWTSVVNAVAKEGPFGDVAKTDKTSLFELLLYMLEMHEQNQKLKLKNRKK